MQPNRFISIFLSTIVLIVVSFSFYLRINEQNSTKDVIIITKHKPTLVKKAKSKAHATTRASKP